MFVSGREYTTLPRDPTPWIVKDLIPVGGLVNVYGKAKAGKSYLVLKLVQAVSAGLPEVLGFPVLKHGPVAYFQIDTPREEWAERFEKLEAEGLNTSNIQTCDMMMTPSYPVNLLEPSQQQWLKTQLQTIKPVVVVIDTLREAHSGDENDSTVMRNVITSIVAAARPAAIVLVSHSRKSAAAAIGADDLMDDSRGSNYVVGRMDVIIRVTKTMVQYEGRGVEKDSFAVKRAENGFHHLDGAVVKYFETLHRRVIELRAENPAITIHKMAETLKPELEKSVRTLSGHIKVFLEKNGLDVKVSKKKAQGDGKPDTPAVKPAEFATEPPVDSANE